MIIPMTPENARITIQLTSADFEAGSFTHDVDLQKLYDNRNSCAYEFVIDYNGQQISNAYQMYYDDGTLYAAVFFPTTDGEMIKLTLTDGEGIITETEPELPAVTSSENGKVLKVVEGAWAAADAPSGLPAVSGSDNGKVLTVSSGEWAAANPTGVSESTVSIMISNAIESLKVSGYSDVLLDVDDDDGCTLTTPYTSTDIVAFGHLYIHTASDDYESDFAYTPSGFKLAKGTSSSVTGDIVISDQADISVTPPVKTGLYIQDGGFENLNVLVTWYYNPDGCYMVTGSFIPGQE